MSTPNPYGSLDPTAPEPGAVREPLVEAFLQARPSDRAALLDAIAHSDRRAALRDVVTRLVPSKAAEA